MAGYVYLIGSPLFRWYKIGKTSNAAVRVSDIGVLLPFRIQVVAVWNLGAYHAMEKTLHEKFSEYRINGEWFSFNPTQIEELVAEMSWAQVDVALAFTNLDEDYAPEGKVLKVKFKKKKNRPEFTSDEREWRKLVAIARRQAKKLMPLSEREERKQSCIKERRFKKHLAYLSRYRVHSLR